MSEKKMETYGFGRINIILLCVSILLIIVGYILLSGGASVDGVSFNEETFSALRISVAPVVLTVGYLGILVAILLRLPKRKDLEQTTEKI